MSNFLTDWQKSLPNTIRKGLNNPFAPIQHAIDRAMESFHHESNDRGLTAEKWENFSLTPRVDIVDTKDELKVEAEMPGMGPKDLKVVLEEGMLTITGEKTISHKDKEKKYLSREIAYGAYQRDISLPVKGLNFNKAKATFKKGMLWICIPKVEGASEHTKELKIDSAD